MQKSEFIAAKSQAEQLRKKTRKSHCAIKFQTGIPRNRSFKVDFSFGANSEWIINSFRFRFYRSFDITTREF